VGIFNKGTDLSNDHPVGTPYCGGGQIAVGNIAGCSDNAFYPAVQGINSFSFVVGDSAVAKENMRIYGSNLSTATVECGSCHDPHNDANPGFLRRSWATGSLCNACHIM
jgi:predicted CXXCH cytochrome family protein